MIPIDTYRYFRHLFITNNKAALYHAALYHAALYLAALYTDRDI
ncbi:MAG: hypothetical protein N2259_01500 [Patescibacteria group bacterium]|nr:hypothetical protein [Patescibacteria group bacterium]